jgi:SAM-dependent methyltransferase
VLDVGCGTGSTTLAVARTIGAGGRCVGIDISDPMIAAARARAERERAPASFIRADAQRHDFEPGSFDMIISRFGVMFFDDSVRAFANLRRAAQDGAELRFIAWRSAVENPFMTTAERAAAPLLPNIPARRPDAPGQFAFADQRRVHRILEESGWTDIDIRPIDVACTLPEKELVRYFTRLGPLGLLLPEVDDRARGQVIETVRAAFAPYVRGAEVCYTAACWMVGARATPAPAAPAGAANA